ncbi:sugar phosphate nucleotidyltransferase [Amycolatopsis sp. SID8362]|uniref:nucleotidyltransferase family protein n=1 Tax=Amycolatopsis sp. SID8362 TaxID=2690346 RepID=UPI00136E4F63|nr:sugar phosphate nucleotidyltransferase [Amycolatopsis sp. SID8362]NBH04210.1 NTP transferase domain-containing protein [Amycolatopsis sp. SID8362]NED40909.1 NTP transferase domain-containing protein [Amycolatopsis sp. SID8362]
MHAVILAGGKGIRLRPYTTRLPKPLVPIGDEFSILDIVLSQLAHCGFDRVTLAIGHLGELVRSYAGDGRRWGLDIDYHQQGSALGTMGPVLELLDRLPEEFLVMNGDVLTDISYLDLLHEHAESGAPLTVATYQRQVQVDFGVLSTVDGVVVDFVEKPKLDYRVSMGVYGLRRQTLRSYTPGLPFGFDELVLDLLARHTPPHEYAFSGYWLDIGRPDDYDRANAEFDLIKESLLKGARCASW